MRAAILLRYSRDMTLEVISKPIFGVNLNQPWELKLGKNHPPFSKGGQGGII